MVDGADYYYQLEDTTAPSNFANRQPTTSENVYNHGAMVPAIRPAKEAVTAADSDYDMARQVSAGQVSDQNRGDCDLADDDDDEYENFTSLQRFVKLWLILICVVYFAVQVEPPVKPPSRVLLLLCLIKFSQSFYHRSCVLFSQMELTFQTQQCSPIHV